MATRLSCLDRVLRSAARLIGRIPKYDHIASYMRDILHWLLANDPVEYRMAALVWCCLLGIAPTYLVELCGPTQNALSISSLRSVEQGLLQSPSAQCTHLHCTPLNLEWPPLSISSLPRTFSQGFLSQVKVVLFGRCGVGSASE